ncbi:MAG: hypothetical protein JSV94_05290 [Methanobacteriota archaeon]|nr:MAG: hypothetical protein JSV94_05290 [Euryarchaeota archaeon]
MKAFVYEENDLPEALILRPLNTSGFRLSIGTVEKAIGTEEALKLSKAITEWE